MRVIHLTRGVGNGVDKACLMTASNMLIGRGHEGDHNHCVCPLIRDFVMRTNDEMPESRLGDLYGPLVWEILGTATQDTSVLQQRAYAFADWAVREIAPLALCTPEGDRLRDLDPIVDRPSAARAANTSRTVDAATYAAYAARGAVRAAVRAAARAAARAGRAAAHTADDVRTAYVADAAAYAADAVVLAAAHAASAAAHVARAAAHTADDADVWPMCVTIIRRVAFIGDQRPVECVITRGQLCDQLGV